MSDHQIKLALEKEFQSQGVTFEEIKECMLDLRIPQDVVQDLYVRIQESIDRVVTMENLE